MDADLANPFSETIRLHVTSNRNIHFTYKHDVLINKSRMSGVAYSPRYSKNGYRKFVLLKAIWQKARNISTPHAYEVRTHR